MAPPDNGTPRTPLLVSDPDIASAVHQDTLGLHLFP